MNLQFISWKDENFYYNDEKEGKNYIPKMNSELYDIVLLTKFKPQRKYTLKELQEHYEKNESN